MASDERGVIGSMSIFLGRKPKKGKERRRDTISDQHRARRRICGQIHY